MTEEEKTEPSILFHSEDVSYVLPDENKISLWLEKVIEKENHTIGFLNYIFCSDDYLHNINVTYLQHDTLTDIITFPYREDEILESDIFISIDRVKENSVLHKNEFLIELYRVMAHGVLHLCGYKDKTPEEEKIMRSKEDEALQLMQKLEKPS